MPHRYQQITEDFTVFAKHLDNGKTKKRGEILKDEEIVVEEVIYVARRIGLVIFLYFKVRRCKKKYSLSVVTRGGLQIKMNNIRRS